MTTLPFKLNDKVLELKSSDLAISLALHVSLIGLFIIFILWRSEPIKQDVRISILEVENSKVPNAVNLSSAEKPLPIPEKPVAPPVFGLSKETLTGNKTGVKVKAGNTIAKELDEIKIDPNEATSLPIPSDEFLITQMPKVLKEIRALYPEEAKAKNYQGTVLFELLIDSAGKVRDIKVLEPAPYGLTEAATKAISQFEFQPAKIEQQTVAVKIRYRFRFELDR